MYYAGIGSRLAPPDILMLMEDLGENYARAGLTLRSGRAPGSDLAFEKGAALGEGKAEIFLPWGGFQKEAEGYFVPALKTAPEWAYEVAEKFHPSWQYLKFGAKALHARNVCQIMGPAQDSELTSFVCCWTPNGIDKGGTAQALRIARDFDIPIYNLFNKEDIRRAEKLV